MRCKETEKTGLWVAEEILHIIRESRGFCIFLSYARPERDHVTSTEALPLASSGYICFGSLSTTLYPLYISPAYLCC